MTRLLSALCLFFVLAGPARALGDPYDQGRFDRLQAQGRPVLVWIHAVWCPTCKAQGKVLPGLLARTELKDVTVLKVDFDSQKPLVRRFRAVQQSTLIMHRGGRETGRSIGDAEPDRLYALLARSP